MRIKNLISIVISTLVLFTSCLKVDNNFSNSLVNTKGEYAILFSNPVTKAQVTSVSGTGYDEFSLFAWNSINDTIMNPYSVVANGVNSYQYENVSGQELQYFKNVSSWYDFIGIIPTDHTMILKDGSLSVKNVTAFTVDDERVEKAVNLTDTLYWSAGLAVESPEEFLTAYKRVAKADYGNVVELPFKHQNALIFLGFSSDKTDTKIIDYVPGVEEVQAHIDTTDIWINLKRGTNVDGSPTKLKGPGESTYTNNAALPAELVSEIKSYYSINDSDPGDYDLHMGNTAWPSTEIRKLRVVKPIPTEYKINFETPNGSIVTVFDGFKYLKDNGYDIQPRTSGGKPDVWDYALLDAFVNGTAYTVVGASIGGSSFSNPEYTTIDYPFIPGREEISGIRVFSANFDNSQYLHIPHTLTADATIDVNGCILSNRVTTDNVIQFSLPVNTTLSEIPVWSSTTFYALPGDINFNFIVVKLSYIYNGITTYDVRVPIDFPTGGLQPGKYYKYELYITSTANGTNDPDEASDEKDEITIEDNPIIQVRLVESGYTQGDERQFTL